VTREGKGVPGAEVTLVPASEEGKEGADLRERRRRAVTAEDGSFRILALPGGEARLVVYPRRGDFPEVDDRSVVSAGGARAIAVPAEGKLACPVELAGGEIRGSVRRAEDGSPVSDISVEVWPYGDEPGGPDPVRMAGRSAFARTDGTGRFRVLDLAPGVYRATAGETFRPFSAPSDDETLAVDVRGPVEVRTGAPADVDFFLPRGGTAVVAVHDPSGKPVPGALVTLERTDVERDPGLGPSRNFDVTDGNGVATVRRLAAGLYVASAQTSGFVPSESVPSLVRSGEKTDLQVELRGGTLVRIRVLDDRGEKVPIALVTFSDARGRVSYVEAGDFAPWFEEPSTTLSPGAYTYRAVAEGFVEQEGEVAVGEGGPLDLLVRLPRQVRSP
jgi:protocatechuate 3,4-dioxygenase beta subunit